MAKMIKKRILFILPVEFKADSERALKEALREFRADPCYSCSSGGEIGWYTWTQGTPRRKPKKAREPQSHAGESK